MQDISCFGCVMAVLSFLQCSEDVKKKLKILHHHYHETRKMCRKMLQQLMMRCSTQLFPLFGCNFTNLSICASDSETCVLFEHKSNVMYCYLFNASILLHTINRNQKQSKVKMKYGYQPFHNRNYIAKYFDIVTRWVWLYLTIISCFMEGWTMCYRMHSSSFKLHCHDDISS